MASTTSVGESGPARRTDFQGGLKKTRRHHHTIEEWNARKEQLAQLYLDEGRNLAETILLMRADGFHASRRKYLEIFDKWGFQKKLTQEDKHILLAKRDARWNSDEKNTIFLQHGRPLSLGRLRRLPWSSSSVQANIPSPSADTPEGVTYHTPQSEDMNWSSDSPQPATHRTSLASPEPASKWQIGTKHETTYQLCQKDFFEFFDENIITFRHLHDDPSIVNLEAPSTHMEAVDLNTNQSSSVLTPRGVHYWVAHHGKPLGPVSVQALGDMMQGPKECPVIAAVVGSSCDAPARSQPWELLEPEQGQMLRDIGQRVFGSYFDAAMAHIEVCLVFSSSVRVEDRIMLRFTASVQTPQFVNPGHPRYDQLKIECRRLRLRESALAP